MRVYPISILVGTALLVLLSVPRSAGAQDAAPLDLAAALREPVLEADGPLREVQDYTEGHVVEMPRLDGRQAWEVYARRLRRQVLEQVVLRGEARRWRNASRSVQWLETLEGGPEYRIRKLRYEAVPGLWVPALLYEPRALSGKAPVVLNLNGHDGDGKAAVYKQVRCINQAKRGLLALNVEWLGMGQLRAEGYTHYRMNQLDLCGTSGLSPYYLSMERALDILLSLEHADPARVAVAGLSGGGWQTITISALDERVTLANPVAGYGSYKTRARHLPDLGDSEQTPTDLAAIADYTHLTALLAPRAALLTFNASDDCCFRAGHTLPPLLEAAEPVYRLFGSASRLRTHVNYDPGTHNFERENREALYSAMGEEFFAESEGYSARELPCDAELKSKEELLVALPDGNADFHTLAMELSRELPREAGLPADRESVALWQRTQRRRLAEVLRASPATLAATARAKASLAGGGTVTPWRLVVDGAWTVPAVELVPAASSTPSAHSAAAPSSAPSTPSAVPVSPSRTRVLLADGGRLDLLERAREALSSGVRVLVVDPFYLGESRISQRDFLYALLVASVGDRPLGIQVGQIGAACRWLKQRYPGEPVELGARGRRTSLVALAVAALEPEAVDSVDLEGSFGSLQEVLEESLSVDKAPELFCFGLLERFDVLQIAALIAPRPLTLRAPGPRAQDELSGLAAWYRLLGREHDPLR